MDPTQKASPIRASSDANNKFKGKSQGSYCSAVIETIYEQRLHLLMSVKRKSVEKVLSQR